VIIFSAIVYKLGFAKKLPVLKSAVVYFVLVIGCYPLAIFAIRFPIVESLMITTVVLGIYKIRLHRAKKNGQVQG
jgi:hypothetical protein